MTIRRPFSDFEVRNSSVLSQLFSLPLSGPGPRQPTEFKRRNGRAGYQRNQVHGVPAFQIELANKALPAGKRPVSVLMLGGTCLLFSTSSAATISTESEPTPSADSKSAQSAPTQSQSTDLLAPADILGAEAALSRNLALYENGKYEACVLGLREILYARLGHKLQRPELIDQAETYLGACLIASGRSVEADQVFAEAIRNNPQMRAPDNLIFPQAVVDRFLRVREQLLSDIRRDERKRVQAAEHKAQQQDEKRRREIWVTQQLRAMAEKEVVIEKNKRWLANVPFGVGQFQNGDNTAGWIFLGLESALLGTCVTALVIDEHLANQALVPRIDAAELSVKREDAHRVIVASSWGLLGVMAGGIAHAHWRFVPERHYTRIRRLPPDLDAPDPPNKGRASRSASQSPVSLSITSMPLGHGLGIVGRF